MKEYVTVYKLEGIWIMLVALAGLALGVYMKDPVVVALWAVIAFGNAYYYGSVGKIVKEDEGTRII